MSNHFRAAMLKLAGDDPRVDLTDLLAFASSQSPANTASSFDLNPFVTGADFNPKTVYRPNIENDGDVQADAGLSFVFSESNVGCQTGE